MGVGGGGEVEVDEVESQRPTDWSFPLQIVSMLQAIILTRLDTRSMLNGAASR